MANEGGMPAGQEKDSLTKMFVGGIDLNTTEDTFRDHFAQFGHIVDSVIIKDQFKKPRGFGFITYTDPKEVDVALDNRPHTIDGKAVEIKRAIPRDLQGTASHLRTKKIFIGGLPSSCKDEDVRSYIEETYAGFGKVVSIELIRDRETQAVKGFGFIELDNEDLVDRMIIDNKYPIIGGKKVEIKKAEPRDARSRGGGQGSRGGRGGGGGGGRGEYRGGGGGGNFYGGGAYGGGGGGGYGGGGGAFNSYQGQGDMYSGNGYNGGGGYGGGGGGSYGGAGGYGGGSGYGVSAGGYAGNSSGGYAQGGASGYGQGAGNTGYGQSPGYGYGAAGYGGGASTYGSVPAGAAGYGAGTGGFNDFSQSPGFGSTRGGSAAGAARGGGGGAGAARYKPY